MGKHRLFLSQDLSLLNSTLFCSSDKVITWMKMTRAFWSTVMPSQKIIYQTLACLLSCILSWIQQEASNMTTDLLDFLQNKPELYIGYATLKVAVRSLPATSCMQMKVNNATCSMQQYSASTDSIYTTNTHHVLIDSNWINYNLSRRVKNKDLTFSKQMSPKQLKKTKAR